MHPSDCRCIKCLVDRSSLGTPEAIAARASVSDEQVARVLARVKELETAPDAWRDERDGRIYVNRRKHPDISHAFDGEPSATPVWFVETEPTPDPAARSHPDAQTAQIAEEAS